MKTYLTSEVIWRQKKPMHDAGIEPTTFPVASRHSDEALFCLTPAGLSSTTLTRPSLYWGQSGDPGILSSKIFGGRGESSSKIFLVLFPKAISWGSLLKTLVTDFLDLFLIWFPNIFTWSFPNKISVKHIGILKYHEFQGKCLGKCYGKLWIHI